MTDAARELSALVRAARAHAARRQTLGERRTIAPESAHRAAPGRAVEDPPKPSRPLGGPRPAPGPSEPDQAPRDRFQSTLAVPRAQANPSRVAGIRERAAACPDLASLRAAVADCTACALAESRTQTVFADGADEARIVFVGEAPGYHEDVQGVPFVGRAGQLLTDIIEKGMGLSRREVVIANVLKCRPPENRDPTAEEKALCTAWLDRQLELVDPELIIALGRHAAGHLLGSEAPLGRLRGRVHERKGRKVIVTYHPAFLLRSPHMKRECWQDIQLAMRELGLPVRDGA
jgi:DNA polymerase